MGIAGRNRSVIDYLIEDLILGIASWGIMDL